MGADEALRTADDRASGYTEAGSVRFVVPFQFSSSAAW